MTSRLDYIDCLRGLAILCVLLIHSGQIITGLPEWLHQFAEYGVRGVQLFFILSALTLVSIYSGREFSARQFFTRRFFRIAPMFYLAAIFYLLWNGTEPRLDTPAGVGWQEMLLTFTFLHGLSWNSLNSIVPGGWSIASEALFYASFPFLLGWVNSGKRCADMLVASLVVSRIALTTIPKLFAGKSTVVGLKLFAVFCFPTQFPAFVGGFAAFFIIRWLNNHRDHFLWKREVALGLVTLVAAMIIFCAASSSKSLRNYMLADLWMLLLVISVYLSQPIILINSAMRYLGRISFSFYLIHFAFIDIFKMHILPTLGDYSSPAQLGITYALVLLASVPLAAVAWRFIEQPMIAFGRRL